LLKKRNKSGWEQRELFNQYFDTPERDLAAAKVALRVRRDGEQFIQTLKTRGQSVAGLSERNEWDWNLAKAKLDLKKLDDSCWPARTMTACARTPRRCSPPNCRAIAGVCSR
jgi:inorganic triphosphatase YgiF